MLFSSSGLLGIKSPEETTPKPQNQQLNPLHCVPRGIRSGNPVLHHKQILARTFRV